MPYVQPTPIYPGDTPAERYSWLMAHLSVQEGMDMAWRKAQRLAWLRANNPAALTVGDADGEADAA